MCLLRPSLCVVILTLVFGLSEGRVSAATSFVGPAGGSVATPGNWDNGVPTLSNVGELAGTDAAVYTDDEDLNRMALDISGDASLSGQDVETEETNIVIRDRGNWSSSRDVVIADGGSASSTVTLRDAATFNVNRDLNVGGEENGFIDHQGGAVNVGRDLSIGTDDDASGSNYRQSSGTLHVGRHTDIANGASMAVNGGTAVIDGRLDLRDAGSSFSQTHGGTAVAGAVRLRRDTTATLSGGQMTTGNNLRIDRDASLSVDSAAVLNVAGDLDLAQNGASVAQTGGEVVVDGNLDIDGGNNRSYDLSGGTLAVGGTIIVSDANSFAWENGGTLALHPNFSVANFDGDLTAAAGARFRVNSAADHLNVFETLTIDDLTVDGFGATLPGYNGSVQTGQSILVRAATLNASASDIAFSDMTGLTRIDAGDPFDPNTESVYWVTVTGNTVAVNWSLAGSAIPEPSTVVLAGFALVLLARRRR